MEISKTKLQALAQSIEVGSNISSLMTRSISRISKVFKEAREEHERFSQEDDKIQKNLNASYIKESCSVNKMHGLATQMQPRDK